MKAKYEKLANKYNVLKSQVIDALTKEIQKSKIKSKHCDDNCIKVSIYHHTELIYHNDNLTFLDENGYHYSVWTLCELEDLIEILNKIK